MRRLTAGIGFVLAFILSCSTTRYTVGKYQNVTSYKISHVYTTASGIKVDDPKSELYPRIIDRMTNEVEACIAALPPKWTQAQLTEGACIVEGVPRNINRGWLTVKVPPDWYVSKCSGEQEFKCNVDPRLCDAKSGTIGLPRDCPCACRATIQSGAIITTPNMKLFKAELARLVTGCNNVWFGELQQCVRTPAYPLVDSL